MLASFRRAGISLAAFRISLYSVLGFVFLDPPPPPALHGEQCVCEVYGPPDEMLSGTLMLRRENSPDTASLKITGSVARVMDEGVGRLTDARAEAKCSDFHLYRWNSLHGGRRNLLQIIRCVMSLIRFGVALLRLRTWEKRFDPLESSDESRLLTIPESADGSTFMTQAVSERPYSSPNGLQRGTPSRTITTSSGVSTK